MGAASILRERANLPWRPIGKRKAQGQIDAGAVYEQRIGVIGAEGAEVAARRITLVMNTPTRDGDTELHWITTIPRERVSTEAIAKAYSARWRIEMDQPSGSSSWEVYVVDEDAELRAEPLSACRSAGTISLDWMRRRSWSHELRAGSVAASLREASVFAERRHERAAA